MPPDPPNGPPDDRRTGMQIFGFPLRVRPFYLLIVAMLGLRGRTPTDGQAFGELVLWMVLVTLSILWHELGHAFAMRRYGYAPSIELHGMGGATIWGDGPVPTPGQRVIVSLAGPFAGFLLGGLVWAVHMLTGPLPHPAAEQAVRLLLWVNIGWGILNLVPMVPWDGGQALHGLLDRFTNGRGARPTAVVTLVLGALALAYVGLVLRELWLGFLVIVSIAAAYRLWQVGGEERPAAATPARAPAAAADLLETVREALARVGPEVLAGAVLRHRPSPDWRGAAESLERHLVTVQGRDAQAEVVELTAWAFLMAGDVDAAEAQVTAMPPTHRPSAALSALVAARRGRWAAALAMARELDLDGAGPTRRRIEAEALIALGRPDEVIALVEDEPDRLTAAFVDESLFRAGLFEHAARLAERTFARFGQADDAYNVACSLARAGHLDEALGWLERAVEAGYRDVAHLEGDEDLARVRALDGYGAIAKRIRS